MEPASGHRRVRSASGALDLLRAGDLLWMVPLDGPADAEAVIAPFRLNYGCPCIDPRSGRGRPPLASQATRPG